MAVSGIRGVVLAGGTGSRLLPLTKVTNKHLLPVGRKPMIFYPVGKLIEAGIQDILIVTGTEHMGDVVGLLGSGKDFGCRFTYRVQDEAGGIAQALGLGREFAAGHKVCVILGDNVFQDSIAAAVSAFNDRQLDAQAGGAHVFLKAVSDPERFGVAELSAAPGDERIIRIVEKPADPPSDLAVTGIYLYGPEVFEIITTLKPSGRGELEISDVNHEYAQRRALGYSVLPGWWTDAGTFESLARASELVAYGE